MIIPNIWENKKMFQTTNQLGLLFFWFELTLPSTLKMADFHTTGIPGFVSWQESGDTAKPMSHRK